jgi:hypothetical protein
MACEVGVVFDDTDGFELEEEVALGGMAVEDRVGWSEFQIFFDRTCAFFICLIGQKRGLDDLFVKNIAPCTCSKEQLEPFAGDEQGIRQYRSLLGLARYMLPGHYLSTLGMVLETFCRLVRSKL